MQDAIDNIFQAAHVEVELAAALLHQQARRFNQTFALSVEEIDQLHAHVDLHASGGAIELFVPYADIVFSLHTACAASCGSDLWELVAFHGADASASRICTMRVAPSASEYTRRLRGARLVTVIGDYLDQVLHSAEKEMRGRVADRLRLESKAALAPAPAPIRMPSVAAHNVLQTA